MTTGAPDPKPRRPLLMYFGGKWRDAPWIIGMFPAHRAYVEPYSGAWGVGFQKPRSPVEVYNDLDSEIVNLFRVIRDPSLSAELERLIRLTPYAREELELSYEPSDNPIEQARRTIVRSYFGYSSDSATRNDKTGLRTLTSGSDKYARLWVSYPDHLAAITARFRGVIIEHKPALEMIEKYDRSDTLFYVDPPYVADTIHKGANRSYRHTMTDDDHRDLASALSNIRGMAIVSGYRSELYDEVFPESAGWRRVEKTCVGQAGAGRGSKFNIECLWLSPRVPDTQMRMEI